MWKDNNKICKEKVIAELEELIRIAKARRGYAMMSLGTKLTLLVLTLPIGILILSDVAIFYHHKTIDVSASIATIAVLLLVWERLRDSLFKKLEYSHKNLLFKLYSAFRYETSIFYRMEEKKRIRSELGIYGRFMSIPLYPRGLLKRIDEFLLLHEEFYGRLQKINTLAEQLIGKPQFSKDLLWHFIGLKPEENLTRFSVQVTQLHKEKSQLIAKEHAQLIDKMIDIFKDMRARRVRRFLCGNKDGESVQKNAFLMAHKRREKVKTWKS